MADKKKIRVLLVGDQPLATALLPILLHVKSTKACRPGGCACHPEPKMVTEVLKVRESVFQSDRYEADLIDKKLVERIVEASMVVSIEKNNPTQVGHASLVEQSLRILEPEMNGMDSVENRFPEQFEPMMDSSAWDDLEEPMQCSECGKDRGELILCSSCPRSFCADCLDRHEENLTCR